MDTCFLFSKYLDEEGCFSLKLAAGGEVLAPPQQRSFAEIRTLQHNSKTTVIESMANAILLPLELSWLSERKARHAIPYALEDQLAQPVEQLHFAFDKLRYQHHHYLITVISKTRMQQLISQLKANHLSFDLITLDWFALDADEAYIIDHTLVVHQDAFKGSLSDQLASSYLAMHPELLLYVFTDSQLSIKHETQKMGLSFQSMDSTKTFAGSTIELMSR